jgi:hypothetical protein
MYGSHSAQSKRVGAMINLSYSTVHARPDAVSGASHARVRVTSISTFGARSLDAYQRELSCLSGCATRTESM